jgi:hypothetical protein
MFQASEDLVWMYSGFISILSKNLKKTMQPAAQYNEGPIYPTTEQFNISYLKDIPGYPSGQDLPEDIRICLDHQVYLNLTRTPIRLPYRLLPILHHIEKNCSIGLTPETALQGPAIYQLLKQCSHCILISWIPGLFHEKGLI